MTAFRDLGLSDEILSALDELGYTEPTAIQEQAIPKLLAGHDVIGQAQTGTGKTAAFGLPLLQYLDPNSEDTQALSDFMAGRYQRLFTRSQFRTLGGLDTLARFHERDQVFEALRQSSLVQCTRMAVGEAS